ncbi:acyl carrier protein, partial [Xanthomonas cannabis]|uniref:acyl carrier protein n=2 Tax=Xanthomonas cannabis TaxID=1885674 RepID=UPI0005736F4D
MHARLPAVPAKAAGNDGASSSGPGNSTMPARDGLLDGLRAHYAADALESELRALIAQTLKMEAEAIACDTPFNEYGFDSILLT